MNRKFEKIGIIYNKDVKQGFDLAQKIKEKLENSEIFALDNLPSDIDLAFCIGGDGTFLKVSRFCAKKNIPILGFNLGRLGYLAQAKPDEIIETIEKFKNNEFTIEKRLMLKSGEKTALNDIVVNGVNRNRTSTMDLYINDTLLCSYVADGLIISTPTGSTAYSLSAGGPIVSPKLDCFLIIPICPHTLTARPIIVPSDEKIIIRSSEAKQKLTAIFDGQENNNNQDEVIIEKNEKQVDLIVLNQQKDKFYDILKEKLHWSIAPRK